MASESLQHSLVIEYATCEGGTESFTAPRIVPGYGYIIPDDLPLTEAPEFATMTGEKYKVQGKEEQEQEQMRTAAVQASNSFCAQ